MCTILMSFLLPNGPEGFSTLLMASSPMAVHFCAAIGFLNLILFFFHYVSKIITALTKTFIFSLKIRKLEKQMQFLALLEAENRSNGKRWVRKTLYITP